MESEKGRQRHSNLKVWLISIGCGVVATIGAAMAILISGLGGHGNPENPIAEFIVMPAFKMMRWSEILLPDSVMQGAGPLLFLIFVFVNILLWTLISRFLIWGLFAPVRVARD